MLTREELRQQIGPLVSSMDTSKVERALQELQRQDEDESAG